MVSGDFHWLSIIEKVNSIKTGVYRFCICGLKDFIDNLFLIKVIYHIRCFYDLISVMISLCLLYISVNSWNLDLKYGILETLMLHIDYHF